VLVEQSAPGGQAGTSSRIENYLGFPSGISGADLARRAATQARRFGAEVIAQEAISVRRDDPYRVVRLADGTQPELQAVVLATVCPYGCWRFPASSRSSASASTTARP